MSEREEASRVISEEDREAESSIRKAEAAHQKKLGDSETLNRLEEKAGEHEKMVITSDDVAVVDV